MISSNMYNGGVDKSKANMIKCPNCEAEYLPDEIYLNKYFLGHHKDIDKDIFGKIIYKDGIEQNLEESYICDKCDCRFNVKAKIEYEVSQDTLNDVDILYETNKYDNRIFLKEE